MGNSVTVHDVLPGPTSLGPKSCNRTSKQTAMTLWPFSRNTLGEKVPQGNASHYAAVKWEEGV